MSSEKQVLSSHAGFQKRMLDKSCLSVLTESAFFCFQDCDFALPQETVMGVQMFRSSSVLDVEEMSYFQTCF